MTEYVPVPVEAARQIAEQFHKSIVIILCHDPLYGQLHVTTYGFDPQNKAWAAQGGEIAARALGTLPELNQTFEDYRLSQAQKLLAALKLAMEIGGDLFEPGFHAKVDELHATVREAEQFLEAPEI